MRIYHNVPALYAYNALNETNNALQKSIQTLSTGLRINSAADDAAGLAISEKMRSQINGLAMAMRNAQDGISMLQTAEGALTETHSMLQRMRELSVQAANDTLTQQDREFIQLEIDELKAGIDRIATTTQFNKKRLLDGSSAALWSTTDLTTKAYVRGSLRQTDQFGQKAAFEGNYKISINAMPGQAEVQKTDVFKIKHENVIMNKSVNQGAGAQDVRVDNLPAGSYKVTATGVNSAATAATTTMAGVYMAKGYASSTALASAQAMFTASADTTVNASVLVEVTNVGSDSMTVRITSSVLTTDGTVKNYVENDVTLLATGTASTAGADIGFGFEYNIDTSLLGALSVGDKMVYNVTAASDGGNADTLVTIAGTQTDSWDYKWQDTKGTSTAPSYNVTEAPLTYALNASSAQGQELHFRNFYVNTDNGTVYEGSVVLTTNAQFNKPTQSITLATFEAGYVGQVAKGDVALRDLDKFWNSSGVFLLNDPQTLNLAQGDGKSASVTLYSTDTLESLKKKLNEAIATGLGQSQYAVKAANHFVSFVEEGDEKDNTSESVAGTMVIRSLVAGDAGKLTFSGEEDLINALSLNVIQDAKENSFSVSIYDAHDSTIIASDVRMSGNLLVGVIHPNVDVEFDAMANIKVEWNDTTKAFALTKEATPYETILHLVENGTVFQVGANENEDVSVDIGNMSADALGISRIVVTDRASAGRATTILDAAIRKVSTQRAKIGAYQNSLEHTVTNLTTTSTNLTAAESRIRDADMSEEMLNFTRLQILSQSGTAMLAQANQLPQTVLSLIRG
jgi:flagellin